jgi:CPA1 family monovalent cation:H+ antiporter
VAHIDLIVFGLLVAVAGLAVVARGVGLPYPILLVLGGVGIGFVPGVPEVHLDPDIVLLLFLPFLLYGAAFFSSLRDLRANVRPIGLLAVGLVVATMVTVAAVAHFVIGLSWPVAFVLGAVVSPTDPVAPSEILRRLAAPRRIVTVIEGESLINDWTALVLYKFAVAAVVTGSFSLLHASGQFVLNGVGGVAIGLVAGRIIREVRRRIDDPQVEITISILSGYAAYLPADELGLSGVIAAVTTGIYMAWYTPELTTAVMRIQGQSVWEVATFLVNAVLFLLVGLQLPSVIDAISGHGGLELAGWAALIAGTVIVMRIVWVLVLTNVARVVFPRDAAPSWRSTAVVSWSGMRGSVSLAAALAIPLSTHAGPGFPGRDLVIFLTFSVILATLVLQGTTLKPLIKLLRIEDDGLEQYEEQKARMLAAEAAIRRADELAAEEWAYDDSIDRARRLYGYRRDRFRARFDDDDDGALEERSRQYQRLTRELLDAERQELLRLRNEGRISDEVRRRVERDFDLEESRLEG